jgi:hypothetical protein
VTTLDRLLDYLPGVYDADPAALLALRLTYDTGQMQWTIADDTLTTSVLPGGPGVPLSVDLSGYTLATLSTFLGTQPGYSVLYLDQTGSSSLSALALVPGSGDIATSNGDHIYVAQNPIWTHLAAIAAELQLAATAIALMPLEMQTTTGTGSWLDVLGSYYAVPRQLGEQDPQYSPRIPAEVILPRQNNMAIAAALTASTGQIASCTDAPVFGNPEPSFDGQIGFSGAPHFFNASAALILNLFDVSVGYDLLGGLGPTDFQVLIRRQVDRLRAAGTHLRILTLTASIMGDVVTGPTDAFVESIEIGGITGTGESFDSGLASGIFPLLLLPLSFSTDSAIATLSGGIRLVGTGVSVDRVASGLPNATGASADSGSADLSTRNFAALSGTGSSADSTFSAIGTVVIFNGVSSSLNSATATLQIGPQLGFGASSDSASGVLTTAVRLVGTAAGSDGATGALASGIRLVGTGSDSESATGALTASIRLNGTGSSADSASLSSGGPFSSEFSAEFAH